MTEVGHADVGAEGKFGVRLGFYVARMLAEPAVPITASIRSCKLRDEFSVSGI